MRSHYCGNIDTSLNNQEVTLCGWVHRRRDHGGVIFIDLRDHEGLAQIVFDPDRAVPFAVANSVRSEFVIRVTGCVRHRPKGTVNSDLSTGEVEVLGYTIEILNKAATPPFQLDDEHVQDDIRLCYRYVDLRRPIMQANMRLRHKVVRAMRDFMDGHGFLEIETPILTRATPEGARDYLVPSRIHPGEFFALPQSPQLFKQLLMMSGMDRYYQIARCFRDEDLRADRQPEFTQLDIEAAFMDEAGLMSLMESMICELFKKVLDVDISQSIQCMSYHESMERFGSDRPDLRNPLELVEISDHVKQEEFKVFSGPAKMKDSRVVALRLPGGGRLSRKEIDDYTKLITRFGAKGLAYIKVNNTDSGRRGLQGPILKFLSDDAIVAILKCTSARPGDLSFFGADKARIVNDSLGYLRNQLGADLNLLEGDWRFVWITDFPMFEYNEDENRWDPLHHPFTAPQSPDPKDLLREPAKALSRAYDLVLNGVELGGGSIRIHCPEMQKATLQLLGIDEGTAMEKFGFLITAMDYGCPPHGGIAFGLDRIVMLMTGADSIRDVIAFPKTQTASCPLTSAPSCIPHQQLRELGIKCTKFE